MKLLRAAPMWAALALAASFGTPLRESRADAGAPPTRDPEPRREVLEGAKLDAVLADIAKARRGLRTLRATFAQERTMKLLATSVKSTGALSFVAPDRLRWELGPPDDVTYWVGPEGLSYKTKTSGATVPSAGANVARGLADLRAMLGGDLSSLRDRYVLTGSRSEGDVEISGAAKEKAASVRGFVLVLDKALTLPLKSRLLEGKSDAIDITFSNAAINVPIDPATMKP